MRSLTLLRHAKTVEGDGRLDDHERPLTPRGAAAARAIGLATAAEVPGVVLCSTALRTRQTLELLAGEWARAPEIIHDRGLYLADRRRLLERIEAIDDAFGSAWLIGHNPGMHELARHCAARARGRENFPELARRFPTAARIRFLIDAESWAGFGRARLTLDRFDLPPEG
jgi:phosphohistidine phosphatase